MTSSSIFPTVAVSRQEEEDKVNSAYFFCTEDNSEMLGLTVHTFISWIVRQLKSPNWDYLCLSCPLLLSSILCLSCLFASCDSWNRRFTGPFDTTDPWLFSFSQDTNIDRGGWFHSAAKRGSIDLEPFQSTDPQGHVIELE